MTDDNNGLRTSNASPDLAAIVGQALIAASLGPGEELAEPFDHALVTVVDALRKRVLRLEARGRERGSDGACKQCYPENTWPGAFVCARHRAREIQTALTSADSSSLEQRAWEWLANADTDPLGESEEGEDNFVIRGTARVSLAALLADVRRETVEACLDAIDRRGVDENGLRVAVRDALRAASLFTGVAEEKSP